MDGTKKVLHIKFETSGKDVVTIALPNPQSALTKAEVETVAQMIIDQNVFRDRKDNTYAKFAGAEIVTVTANTLN